MPRGEDGWIDRQRQTERYNEDNKCFSLFMRVRTKIKILKIVSLHVTFGEFASLRRKHILWALLGKGLGIILVRKGKYVS